MKRYSKVIKVKDINLFFSHKFPYIDKQHFIALFFIFGPETEFSHAYPHFVKPEPEEVYVSMFNKCDLTIVPLFNSQYEAA